MRAHRRAAVRLAALLALGLFGSACQEPPTVAPTQEAGFLVVFVVDGDTILLENGESLRYLGIDAPETHHPERGTECYGPEAAERNRQLVEGRIVQLEPDQTDRDAYDRLLRYVYVDGLFVNAKLVEEGYAYASFFPPDTKHYAELLRLEMLAEEQGLGLWSACPR